VELTERVRRAVAELPDQLREVVILRLYEGLDYAAIAEVVGAGEATVRSRMRYALQALRRSVGRAD
jgi:RNA polymerase sigma-70 factor (ECF subfamily)